MTQTLLITGCSSGIGKALAQTFLKEGWRVGVTARHADDLKPLIAEGALAFVMDLTDDASIARAVNAFVSRVGSLDMLINNAGYGAMGPLAEMPLVQIRKQMETNFTGQLATIQHAVPQMISQGKGRIVNIGSVTGVLPTPFSGAYAASKAAFHAASDALRLELASFGIEVVTVQPGGIASRFGTNAQKNLASTTSGLNHYASSRKAIEERARVSQQGAMDLERFAEKLARKLLREKVPPLIRMGSHSRTMPLLAKWFPVKLRDTILKKRFAMASQA